MADNQSSSSSSSGGCNCVGCIVTILVLCALWFGLLTPWGTLNIDIFPPAIRLDTPQPETSGVR